MSMKGQNMISKSTRWSIPAFFTGVGAVCLVAAAVGGHVAVGLVVFGVLAVCSLIVILLWSRSETYRNLTEEPDERFASINLRAWAGVGWVLTLANAGAFIGDLASGRGGNPYYWLVAVAGIAYIVFVALLRRNS